MFCIILVFVRYNNYLIFKIVLFEFICIYNMYVLEYSIKLMFCGEVWIGLFYYVYGVGKYVVLL